MARGGQGALWESPPPDRPGRRSPLTRCSGCAAPAGAQAPALQGAGGSTAAMQAAAAAAAAAVPAAAGVMGGAAAVPGAPLGLQVTVMVVAGAAGRAPTSKAPLPSDNGCARLRSPSHPAAALSPLHSPLQVPNGFPSVSYQDSTRLPSPSSAGPGGLMQTTVHQGRVVTSGPSLTGPGPLGPAAAGGMAPPPPAPQGRASSSGTGQMKRNRSRPAATAYGAAGLDGSAGPSGSAQDGHGPANAKQLHHSESE